MSGMIIPRLANAVGPRRRHPLMVAPEPGPYRAALTDAPDGVAVRVSRDDRPRGARLVWVGTIDAPLHVVADRLHAELARLNRGRDLR